MYQLPPRPDLDQLRRQAKERLKAARAGDAEALAWISEVDAGVTLSASQLRLARDHGFSSWPQMQLEISRRLALDLRDPGALAAFLDEHPGAAAAELTNWVDHPRGASPLGYLAMARYDTATGKWGAVVGTATAAQLLLASGAPVDGHPKDPETPLITAASYGDPDIAAVLIASGADVDAVAADDAGGVPGGTAVLHAAVFGMTEVLDVLVAAGARVASMEEAAAAGDLTGWPLGEAPEQRRVCSLVMAAHHQRLDVIDQLVAAGTPFDVEDEAFGRHPLNLACQDGRLSSVRHLLALGADPGRRDPNGKTPLDHCRAGRAASVDTTDHDEIEAMLTAG